MSIPSTEHAVIIIDNCSVGLYAQQLIAMHIAKDVQLGILSVMPDQIGSMTEALRIEASNNLRKWDSRYCGRYGRYEYSDSYDMVGSSWHALPDLPNTSFSAVQKTPFYKRSVKTGTPSALLGNLINTLK